MRHVWFLLGALACTSSSIDPGIDSGRDAGPDHDIGPDTTICFDYGSCESRPCEFVGYYSGVPELGLETEQWTQSETIEPLEDGGTAHAVWGFQGGLMLQPNIRIALEDFDTELRCAEVVITHTPVEGAPFDIPEHDQRFELVDTEEIRVFDAFSFEGANEREMDLEITVRTETWARTTGTLRVTIDEGALPR